MGRQATAVWTGTLKEGKGVMSAPSGVLNNAAYTFSTRFENAAGTNPEELIAAAHAGCYSMAFSGKLVAQNLTPARIETTAALTMEKTEAGMTVTKIHLTTRAKVPGATPDVFAKAAEDARATCPVSRLLKATITLDAKLEA
ncbi:MAG TPA: OsmC family protein [Gemmatimonadaceae bacterium]|nr:OsmC family protein [Gemmatimonadaceae bacterium]